MGPRLVLLFEFQALAVWLLPLLPALVALYFLKLKRREVVVSSTYLWRRSVQDLQVNAPFQRLRRNLLLLLQLLILLALLAAASKPVVRGAAETGRNLLVLIDCSASMNVREEGGTRLELARKEAERLVSGLGPGDRMAVIAFSSRSPVLQPLTADRGALSRAIAAAAPTALPGDLLQALRTVEAIAQSLPAAEVHLLGDGAYGGMGELPAELERFDVQFTAVGKAAENVGITELDVRRSFSARERTELFASVKNPTGEDRRAVLGLYQADRLLTAAELMVPKKGSRSHTFDLTRLLTAGGEAGGPSVLRLEVSPGGLLDSDDSAWLKVAPPEPVSVLVVGEPNPFLDRVLAVQARVEARRVPLAAYLDLLRSGKLASDPARVLIFDAESPSTPPDRPALYLGCAPALSAALGSPGDEKPGGKADSKVAASPRVKAPSIVDWDRSHPVNRFLAFADLRIEESLAFKPGRGYRSLIDAGDTSIAGTATFPAEGRPPVTCLLVGFDIRKTNWPWLHSFPIFFSNTLEWLGRAAGSEALPRYRTGEVLVYYPRGKKLESPVFRDPLGREQPAVEEKTGELTFAGTDLAGIYELRSGGNVVETYAVSLLSAAETDITPLKELRFGSRTVEARAAEEEAKELWKPLVLLALAVLALEWWVYNRRMHI